MEKTEKGRKIYLTVPYKEKDEAKKLGARWDPDSKLWYIPLEAVLDLSVDVRKLLDSWYEEPVPVKAEPLKIPENEVGLLLKKLKNLFCVSSALYDDKA